MNRYVALGCLGIGLMVSPLLSGLATGAVPATTKIGVIDIESTLYDTPAGKRANAAFEKARGAKQAKLDADNKAILKAAADLDKQKTVLKKDVFDGKKAELEKQYIAMQKTMGAAEKDLAGERTKLVQELLSKAGPIIEEIAKKEGVSIIIDKSSVIWMDPAVDLTAPLNARMK